MSTLRTHFTFRVDTWTAEGESVVEHVAGVEDYQVALATFCAACERWPGTPIRIASGRSSGMAAAFFLDKPQGTWTKIGIAIAGLLLGWLCYSIASNILTYMHTAPGERH
jgi:hypothetical protein